MSIYIDGKKIKENKSFDRILTSNDDINTLYTNGFYQVNKAAGGVPKNFSLGDYCYIWVKPFDKNDIKQMVFLNDKIFIRQISLTNKPSFVEVARTPDIRYLQKQIDDLKKQIGGVNKHYYLPELKEVVA